MSRNLCLAVGLGLVAWLAAAQSSQQVRFMSRAVIKHGGSQATVLANDSTPLLQTVQALRLEYGWQINWESAPGYSRFDVVDDTVPKWRAAHPAEKGVTRPAGGVFEAAFPEPDSDPDGERIALAKLIEQYNATANPGRYVLRIDSDGQLTVVGTQVRNEEGAFQEVTPLLDTPIALATARRSVDETINSILGAIESVTGKKIIVADLSPSLFINTEVTVGGETAPARKLLKRALAATKRPIQYDLCYNADMPAYILTTSLAAREEENGTGARKLVPVDRVTKR